MQYRMQFSDVLLVTGRGAGGQFRAHAALPLSALSLTSAEIPHSFQLQGSFIYFFIAFQIVTRYYRVINIQSGP
jgi:hypothetical protein